MALRDHSLKNKSTQKPSIGPVLASSLKNQRSDKIRHGRWPIFKRVRSAIAGFFSRLSNAFSASATRAAQPAESTITSKLSEAIAHNYSTSLKLKAIWVTDDRQDQQRQIINVVFGNPRMAKTFSTLAKEKLGVSHCAITGHMITFDQEAGKKILHTFGAFHYGSSAKPITYENLKKDCYIPRQTALIKSNQSGFLSNNTSPSYILNTLGLSAVVVEAFLGAYNKVGALTQNLAIKDKLTQILINYAQNLAQGMGEDRCYEIAYAQATRLAAGQAFVKTIVSINEQLVQNNLDLLFENLFPDYEALNMGFKNAHHFIQSTPALNKAAQFLLTHILLTYAQNLQAGKPLGACQKEASEALENIQNKLNEDLMLQIKSHIENITNTYDQHLHFESQLKSITSDYLSMVLPIVKTKNRGI